MANDTVAQELELTVRCSETTSAQPESEPSRDITTPSIPESIARNLETTHQLESTTSSNAASETIQEQSDGHLETTTSQNESVPNLDTTTSELSDRDFETNISPMKSPETTLTIQELLARNFQCATSQPDSATQSLHEPQVNSGTTSQPENASNLQTTRQSIRNSPTTLLTGSASSPTYTTIMLGPIPPIENKTHLVGPKPTVTICHICGHKVRTVIYHSATLKTHLTALCLCVFGCGFCAYLPYCLKSSHNIDHYCSYCSSYLGTFFMK